MKIAICPFSYFIPILLFVTSSQAFAQVTTSGQKMQEAWAGEKKQFEKSFKRWQDLKDHHQGNYSYTKKWSSWTGFGHTTTIIVSKNRVTERKFESIGAPHPDGRPVDKNRWTERGDFIGSSSNKQAHPAKTLDQLYAEAKELLAKPIPPFHKGVLQLNEQGLLINALFRIPVLLMMRQSRASILHQLTSAIKRVQNPKILPPHLNSGWQRERSYRKV